MVLNLSHGAHVLKHLCCLCPELEVLGLHSYHFTGYAKLFSKDMNCVVQIYILAGFYLFVNYRQKYVKNSCYVCGFYLYHFFLYIFEAML